MRERDRANGRTGWMVRPRYMVWENVPGAFSSNGGKDFQAVLTEIARVAEPDAPDVPLPEKGKWSKAGCLYGAMGEWSIAWRVHDAQFWGVPQRRKRISLVADFGGLSAPEILFEREGLSGDPEPSGEAWKETAGAAGGGVEGTSWGIDHVITTGGNCTAQGPCVYEEVEATLKAAGPHAVFSAISFQERAGKPGGGKGILIQHEHVGALSTLNNQSVLQTREPILLESNQNHATVQTDGISTALPASMGMGGGYVPMVTAYGIGCYNSKGMLSPNPHSGIYEADTARTLDLNGGSPACNQGGIAVVQPSYCLQGNGIGRSDNAGCNGKGWTEEVSYTLNTIDRPAVVQSVGCDVYNQEVTGEVAASLTAASGGTNTSGPKVLRLNDQGGSVMGVSEDVTGALRAEEHGHRPIVYENHSQDSRYKPLGDISETVSAKYRTGGNNQPLVVSGTYQAVTGALTPGAHPGSYNGQDAYNDMLIAAIDCRNGTENTDTNGTLQAKENGGQNLNYQNTVRCGAIVRRLTPLECERLQGYPDGWTDIGEWVDSNGKKHKDADSPRYKALGNSIALPFWQWMARRICTQYERTVTMASLFDGIGGFPLVFQRCGAVPVWASEIEEFPIAVTKVRFPE